MANSGVIWAATVPADGAGFFGADLGTTLPTTATAALNASFWDHGWIGEKGITNGMKRDVTKHKAWGGETVKVTQDNYEETITITFLETSDVVLRTVFGVSNVVVNVDGTLNVEHSPLMLPRRSYVVEAIDGDKSIRTVLREAQMTSVDDIVQVHTDMLMYSCTFDVFKTSAGLNGVVQYIDNGTEGS